MYLYFRLNVKSIVFRLVVDPLSQVKIFSISSQKKKKKAENSGSATDFHLVISNRLFIFHKGLL
jgi:hypothetical protein